MKITKSELQQLIKEEIARHNKIKQLQERKKEIRKQLNEYGFTNEESPFQAHGFYTVSNAGGYEIMLNDRGDAAKVRDAYGSDVPEISDWLEIEYVPDEDTEEMEPVIDPNGYNIPLNQVVKTNY